MTGNNELWNRSHKPAGDAPPRPTSSESAISLTTAPGAKLSATIARFWSALPRRRRSGPVMTSTLAIAPSLTPVLAPSLAPVLTNLNQRRSAGGPHRTVTLELQKLMYFARAIFLIETDDPLVSGWFEAWQYGPVHPAAPMRERPGWTGPRLRRSRRWGAGSGSLRSGRTPSQITTCCDAWDSLLGQTGHIRSLCFYPWLERISN